MNQKAAKLLRKTMRVLGTEPTEKVYQHVNTNIFNLFGTLELTKDCGRHKYQQLKGK